MAEHSSNMFVNTCPACERQERYLDEVNSQRNDSLREQRILQEQQEKQQQEQEWAEDERAEALVAAQKDAAEKVAAAQKKVADEIKKTRETDTFFKQREYAEKGDCNAQYYIGGAFENGVGTEKDIDAAISWWRKAENNGSWDAGKKLRGIYSDRLEKANSGNDNAINFIIWAFENGVGTKQDTVAATAWTNKFERLKEERAKALAEAAAAEQAAADEKRRQELEWATNLKLADSGNSDAQFYIGSRSDSPHKEKYLRKAAEQGHPDAQLNLANLLSDMIRVRTEKEGAADWDIFERIKEIDEAIYWYRKCSHNFPSTLYVIETAEESLRKRIIAFIDYCKWILKKRKKESLNPEYNYGSESYTYVLMLCTFYISPIFIFYLRVIFQARHDLTDLYSKIYVYVPGVNLFLGTDYKYPTGLNRKHFSWFTASESWLSPFAWTRTEYSTWVSWFYHNLNIYGVLERCWPFCIGVVLAVLFSYWVTKIVAWQIEPNTVDWKKKLSTATNAYVARYPNLPKPSSLP